MSTDINSNDPSVKPVNDFLHLLLKAQGFSEPKFTKQEINQAFSELAELFQEFVITSLVSHLSDKDMKKVDQMLENNEPQQNIVSFLQSNIEGFQGKVAVILQDFSKSYLGENI